MIDVLFYVTFGIAIFAELGTVVNWYTGKFSDFVFGVAFMLNLLFVYTSLYGAVHF
jgi:outer membrane translocation and assembly module TamA